MVWMFLYVKQMKTSTRTPLIFSCLSLYWIADIAQSAIVLRERIIAFHQENRVELIYPVRVDSR